MISTTSSPASGPFTTGGRGIDARIARQHGLREREPDVFVSKGGLVSADASLTNALRRHAAGTEKGRARILFHPRSDDPLHEMMIAARRMTIWPPHINTGSPKSWRALEGEIAYVQFAPPGEITDVKYLAGDGCRLPSFLRLSDEHWHTIVPISEMAVYMETRCGPFAGTRFAEWGPQSDDDADLLKEALDAFNKQD